MFTLPASIRRGARLDAVARAVATASGKTRLIYVEAAAASTAGAQLTVAGRTRCCARRPRSWGPTTTS